MFDRLWKLGQFLSLSPQLTRIEFRAAFISYCIFFTACGWTLTHHYEITGSKVWHAIVVSSRTLPRFRPMPAQPEHQPLKPSTPTATEDQTLP